MIDPTKSFLCFADCEVEYSGRATSLLARGNYLLIYKEDRCFAIHGSSNIGPRNYQSKGTKLSLLPSCDQTRMILTAVNRQETIIVTIFDFIWEQITPHWSDNQVVITKTEKELVDKIVRDPELYFGFVPDSIETEHRTSSGPIDILAIKDGRNHIVEAKRKTANINNFVQLRKYMECFEQSTGYIAAPSIAAGAIKYSAKYGLRYMPVTW